ncbi:hypothetical protein [Allokutzneria oryzae]|uniref:Uncharacterized protein n=1 Tax=Allokutzneria oryzae TaxID=1378989 RepID=A0ABV5ZX86_9PSEU
MDVLLQGIHRKAGTVFPGGETPLKWRLVPTRGRCQVGVAIATMTFTGLRAEQHSPRPRRR